MTLYNIDVIQLCYTPKDLSSEQQWDTIHILTLYLISLIFI